MKRGVFDILRRGVDNAIANWPLLLLRLAESILFLVTAIVAVILMVVPIIVSIGIHFADFANIGNLEELVPLLETIYARWTIILYILGIAFLITGVFMVVHSFLEAGCARVYVDGDEQAGPELRGPVARYRAFSMAKWWAGAVDGWWPVFWMYNIAWGTALLFIAVPALITIVLSLLAWGKPMLIVGISCFGLILILLLLIPIGIVTSIWTNRAIATWAVRGGGARDTLSAAWAAFKAEFGRHLLVAIVMIVVSFAGSMFIGSFTTFAGVAESIGRHSDSIMVMMLPLRFAGQFIGMAFSAAVAGWFLASFCAIANE